MGRGHQRPRLLSILQLPAPQRKLIREVILTFAKVHLPDERAPLTRRAIDGKFDSCQRLPDKRRA